ncbi:C-type lectin domain family 3 member a [Plakobranchus ocellatus]|uniref:C-type lectin domain family 3 member a n=1 Tax=Plakobranchus ocellatus TaxID=259542 RepID=A0AAV4BPG4_9GAST|nr:C-type lectin domain family 3 member a [Plakobranchus ocellatus]
MTSVPRTLYQYLRYTRSSRMPLSTHWEKNATPKLLRSFNDVILKDAILVSHVSKMSESAARHRNHRVVMVMVLLIIIFTTSVKGKDPAMNLKVSRRNDPTAESGVLVVDCSVNSWLTKMSTVTSLTVLGSKPYRNQRKFDELAVVDIWSPAPKLTNYLKNEDVVIRGKTAQENFGNAYLVLSWNSQSPFYRHYRYFKCVANGLDPHKQAASISKTVNVGMFQTDCSQKMDSIDSQLREMAEALPVQVENLHSKVEALESKLETFHLIQMFHFKMRKVDTDRFDVSPILKDRFYLASKDEVAFNIEAANQECKSSGGYLVELDDLEEYRNLLWYFLERVPRADTFWTGGNDIDIEGEFIYYNSRKPVPNVDSWWMRGQPDNAGDSEDCLEIRKSYDGLINDWICGRTGKFVCEIELETRRI